MPEMAITFGWPVKLSNEKEEISFELDEARSDLLTLKQPGQVFPHRFHQFSAALVVFVSINDNEL
jgi:hypothetical protein